MIKFNMNNYVYFKPTSLGKQVYTDYYKKWDDVDSNVELEVDKDGYAKLQFHSFVSIYGTCIMHYYSAVDEVFEAYEFYIDEEDLI